MRAHTHTARTHRHTRALTYTRKCTQTPNPSYFPQCISVGIPSYFPQCISIGMPNLHTRGLHSSQPSDWGLLFAYVSFSFVDLLSTFAELDVQFDRIFGRFVSQLTV